MKRTGKPIQQLLQTLPPRQQTLDFADASRGLWQQWSCADHKACISAIAALLAQVTLATQNEESKNKETREP